MDRGSFARQGQLSAGAWASRPSSSRFFAALLLLASLAVPARADDWRELRRGYERLFTAPAAAEEREKLLDALAASGRADAVSLLLDAAQVLENEAEPLRVRLTDVHRRLEPLQQDVLLPAQHDERDMLDLERGKLANGVRDLELAEERIVDRLSTTRSPEILKALAAEAVKHEAWLAREIAVRSLGRLAAPEALPSLVKAADDKDARVRMRAAEAFGKVKGADSVRTLARLLERDPDGRVRQTAVASFLEIGGIDAVESLIGALSRERGTILEDATEALQRLTRQTLGPIDAAWRDWWEANKKEFAGSEESVLRKRPLPRPRGAAGSRSDPPMSFVGIESRSDKVVFVIDISDSMRDSSSSTFLPETGTPERSGVARSKMDVAKAETKKAIRALTERDKFNIVVYNHNVKKWMDRLVPANDSNKALALAFIDKLEPSGGTNIFDALETTFNMGGFGAYDRYYQSELDTIILFSDGAPSAGRIQNLDEIRAEIARINSLQKIKIHTVALGKLADVPFLKELAKENRGRFAQRD